MPSISSVQAALSDTVSLQAFPPGVQEVCTWFDHITVEVDFRSKLCYLSVPLPTFIEHIDTLSWVHRIIKAKLHARGRAVTQATAQTIASVVIPGRVKELVRRRRVCHDLALGCVG